jgi:hypothetical protein
MKISGFSNDTIEEAVDEALKQIDDMNYRAELIEKKLLLSHPLKNPFFNKKDFSFFCRI